MPNDDYILRRDAKQALIEVPAELDAEAVQRCIEALNKVPAANVEPVIHAYWTYDKKSYILNCSHCGAVAPYNIEADRIFYWPELKYCYKCGAKMDEEENND